MRVVFVLHNICFISSKKYNGDMKKLFIYILLAAFLLIPSGGANAQLRINVPEAEDDALFDLELVSAEKIKDTNLTRFELEPINIKNNQSIDHWKIRVWCDEVVTVTINDGTTNSCGSALMAKNNTSNKFFLTFSNSTTMPAAFSLKLKAYDKDGNWLHSEKESFIWK